MIEWSTQCVGCLSIFCRVETRGNRNFSSRAWRSVIVFNVPGPGVARTAILAPLGEVGRLAGEGGGRVSRGRSVPTHICRGGALLTNTTTGDAPLRPPAARTRLPTTQWNLHVCVGNHYPTLTKIVSYKKTAKCVEFQLVSTSPKNWSNELLKCGKKWSSKPRNVAFNLVVYLVHF